MQAMQQRAASGPPGEEGLDSCRDSKSSYSYGVGSGMGGGYVWEARVRKYAQRLEVFNSAKC